MDVVGHGFLATHLTGYLASRPDAHPGVVVLAAGVSAAGGVSAAEFARERALLEDTIGRCRRTGQRLVFFSTASTGMYGASGRGAEDEPVAPRTPYGRHKLELEHRLRGSGADHLVLRLAHVVGPDQPAHQLLPSLASQVCAGEVRLYRSARRDIIDIADVVRLIDELLAAGVRREVVNIATGFAVPVERIVARIEARLGVRARHVVVDTPPVNHLVCTRKLRRLVPAVAGMAFDDRYHERVLDRYLSPVAATPH